MHLKLSTTFQIYFTSISTTFSACLLNAGTGRPYYDDERRENTAGFVDLDQTTPNNSTSPNSVLTKPTTNGSHPSANCNKTSSVDLIGDSTRLENPTKVKPKKGKPESSDNHYGGSGAAYMPTMKNMESKKL